MSDYPSKDLCDQYSQLYHDLSTELGALSHPTRLSILLTLYVSEHIPSSRSVYYSKLCEVYGIKDALMTYHLKRLEKAGLIQKKNAENLDIRYRVYSATEKGKKLISDLGLDKAVLALSRTKSML